MLYLASSASFLLMLVTSVFFAATSLEILVLESVGLYCVSLVMAERMELDVSTTNRISTGTLPVSGAACAVSVRS